MGYTHHDAIAVTGSGGLAVGSATAGETMVMSSAGAITAPAGQVFTDSSGGVVPNVTSMNFETVLAAGSSTVIWSVIPYACNVSGYVTFAVSSGTGRTVTVNHGSAGDIALTTGTQGVTGTIGKVLTFTAGTVACTAGEVFRVVTTTCATAQTYGVTVVLTRTA